MPAEGLLLSAMLARLLDVGRATAAGRGARGPAARAPVPVAGTVDDAMGLQAYMDIEALRAAAWVRAAVSGAYLTSIRRRRPLLRAREALPAVAGVASSEAALQSFRETMAENMNVMIFMNVCSPASSRSASSTTPPACRSRSGAASWRACGCSASRARRSR
jgi:putative ABC transport system permease protein